MGKRKTKTNKYLRTAEKLLGEIPDIFQDLESDVLFVSWMVILKASIEGELQI